MQVVMVDVVVVRDYSVADSVMCLARVIMLEWTSGEWLRKEGIMAGVKVT